LFRWQVRFLTVTIILLVSIPVVLAESPQQGQELVTNGGFENGMAGWKAISAHPVTGQQQDVYDVSNHPPHSGQYSAQVGAVNQPGTLSQTVTIPLKSEAKFSAWYRLDQGTSLTIILKNSDGSIIQQWAGSGSEWTQVTYDLGPSYAGKSVTIEFDGQANSVSQSTTGLCGFTRFGFPYYCLYQAESDYYAFVDDVSMVATLAQYMSGVSLSGLPKMLSTKVFVDDTQIAVLTGNQSQQFAFNIGETHKISVDNAVYQDNTTRFYTDTSFTTVSTDGQVTFSYRKQYYLSINTPYGTTSGAGWYYEGSKATYSVRSPSVPMPGLLGTLGAKYNFEKWVGDDSTTNLQSSILMDAPRSVSATWKPDYTILLVVIGAIAVACVACAIGYRKLVKVVRKRQATAVYESQGVVVDVSQADEPTSARENQTIQAAEQMESEKTEQASNERRRDQQKTEDENRAEED
jgi:hypothetical protein